MLTLFALFILAELIFWLSSQIINRLVVEFVINSKYFNRHASDLKPLRISMTFDFYFKTPGLSIIFSLCFYIF